MFFGQKKEGETTPQNGKLRLILIVGGALIGILLLLFGGSIGNTKEKEEDDRSTVLTPQEELDAYQAYLEKRVKTLCESVHGVDNVTVAVTLNGSFEEIYATEWIDGNEEYVIVGSGSNASALYLSRTAPEIAGIGVVCNGGGNTNVRQELLSLLCATFRVPANRVYITEAKY